MSEKFITISKDVFAVEALRVMNENKITEIFRLICAYLAAVILLPIALICKLFRK